MESFYFYREVKSGVLFERAEDNKLSIYDKINVYYIVRRVAISSKEHAREYITVPSGSAAKLELPTGPLPSNFKFVAGKLKCFHVRRQKKQLLFENNSFELLESCHSSKNASSYRLEKPLIHTTF